jgi:hypothetical protein
MTLAIAHQQQDGRVILDAVRERKPPFKPSEVVAEFAATLKAYGCDRVTGDRYAGEWPRERFQEHGVSYDTAEKPKSDIYRDLLPLLNSRQVELLDHPRLIAQLCSLERRTARGGKDSIDHPPNGRDDVGNAAAGALLAAGRGATVQVLIMDLDANDSTERHPFARLSAADRPQLEAALPLSIVQQPSPDLTCGNCIWRELKNGRPYCEAQLLYVKDTQPACAWFDPAPKAA